MPHFITNKSKRAILQGEAAVTHVINQIIQLPATGDSVALEVCDARLTTLQFNQIITAAIAAGVHFYKISAHHNSIGAIDVNLMCEVIDWTVENDYVSIHLSHNRLTFENIMDMSKMAMRNINELNRMYQIVNPSAGRYIYFWFRAEYCSPTPFNRPMKIAGNGMITPCHTGAKNKETLKMFFKNKSLTLITVVGFHNEQ